MRKIIILSLFIIAPSIAAKAQEVAKNAIGLRIGDNKGFGTEINYQRGLKENKRLEFGLAWHSKSYYDAYKITGLHQWVWNFEDKLNWYAGVGGGVGSMKFDRGHHYYTKSSTDTYVFLAGNIGFEYHLDIPLLLFIDLRPEISFGDYRDDLVLDIAIGARYKF